MTSLRSVFLSITFSVSRAEADLALSPSMTAFCSTDSFSSDATSVAISMISFSSIFIGDLVVGVHGALNNGRSLYVPATNELLRLLEMTSLDRKEH